MKTKTIALSIALSIAPFAIQAEEITDQKVQKACTAIHDIAAAIMDGRQNGVPMTKGMAISNKELHQRMVREAYDIPRWNDEDLVRKTIQEFANKQAAGCYAAFARR